MYTVYAYSCSKPAYAQSRQFISASVMLLISRKYGMPKYDISWRQHLVQYNINYLMAALLEKSQFQSMQSQWSIL